MMAGPDPLSSIALQDGLKLGERDGIRDDQSALRCQDSRTSR
jgi:hypothetical protein